MVGQAKASLIKIKTLLSAEGWNLRDYGRLISSVREGAAAIRRRPRRRCLEFTGGIRPIQRGAVERLGGGLCNSEIRLIGGGDGSVFFGAVFMRVFCTDLFRPFAEGAPIGFGCGPSCCEDVFVLDRELELQSLALVAGVGRPPFSDSLTAAGDRKSVV